MDGTQIAFIWDGWNMISEQSNTHTNYMIWGLDLSGTLNKAGGVGGLLSASFNGINVFYAYDANGNVSDVVDSSGLILAHYEYDPFGNKTQSTGTFANINPWQFSTKYWESETQLLHYQLRPYIPSLGRWLTRDPIEENGGVNLYGFVRNNGIEQWDCLGFKRLRLRYDLAPEVSFGTRAIPVKGFSEILKDVESKINKRYSKDGKGKCNCIEYIMIGGHGGPGKLLEGKKHNKDAYLTNAMFSTYNSLKNKKDCKKYKEFIRKHLSSVISINKISKYMCTNGKIEIVACKITKGKEGKEFTKHMEDLFGKGNFIGYPYNVKWGPFGVSKANEE